MRSASEGIPFGRALGRTARLFALRSDRLRARITDYPGRWSRSVKAIIGNALMPGLLDHYLAKSGYSGQLTDQPRPRDAPANLFTTVDGGFGAHGRFDARGVSWEMFTSRHRNAATIAVLGVLGVGAAGLWRAAGGAVGAGETEASLDHRSA